MSHHAAPFYATPAGRDRDDDFSFGLGLGLGYGATGLPASVHLSPEELAAIDYGIEGQGSAPSAPFAPGSAQYHAPPPPSSPLASLSLHAHRAPHTPSPLFAPTPPATAPPAPKDTADALRGLQHRCAQLKGALAAQATEKAQLERAVADLRAQLQRPGAFPDRDRLAAHYEERISACHQHYDRKISALIQRFEQERQSNAEIMRARMKAEVNLLLPRIRQQCLEQATRRTQEAVDHVKAKCAAYLRRMREDFDGERAALKEQMRRKLDQDRHVIYGQLKEKFDHRLAQELSHQPPAPHAAPHANPPAGSSAAPSWLDRSFVF